MLIPPETLLRALEPAEKVLWWEKPEAGILRRANLLTFVWIGFILSCFVYMLASISQHPLTISTFPDAVAAGATRLVAAGGIFPAVAAIVLAGFLYVLYHAARKIRAAGT